MTILSSGNKSGEIMKHKNVHSSSESCNNPCPHTLRETKHLQFMNTLYTVGDIVSIKNNVPNSKIIIYAQIIKLHENDLGEKRASIIWLAPKANIGITDNSKKVYYDTFIPNEFAHISVDERLAPISCLTFVMNVPNLFEYKFINIGTNHATT
ncbi:unnamed protein product [Aphis gossypii]|uniref:GATA zinc finger domain-containing protein 1 n=1 Tax=Aphis gossypii TaxID=80765 RepID=A0A9P0J927_APHGO|nr:unnamed protein product [Aphis gossypii]